MDSIEIITDEGTFDQFWQVHWDKNQTCITNSTNYLGIASNLSWSSFPAQSRPKKFTATLSASSTVLTNGLVDCFHSHFYCSILFTGLHTCIFYRNSNRFSHQHDYDNNKLQKSFDHGRLFAFIY